MDAKIRFLMENPGPMTDETALSARIGSGFISRDNNVASAEATWRFLVDAGLDRELSVLWNVIPWRNGTGKISRDEHIAGSDQLSKPMDRLPNLKVVVGVGHIAQRAKGLIEKSGVPFITSAHPSPINRAARPFLWAAIPGQWSQALRYVSEQRGRAQAEPTQTSSGRHGAATGLPRRLEKARRRAAQFWAIRTRKPGGAMPKTPRAWLRGPCGPALR